MVVVCQKSELYMYHKLGYPPPTNLKRKGIEYSWLDEPGGCENFAIPFSETTLPAFHCEFDSGCVCVQYLCVQYNKKELCYGGHLSFYCYSLSYWPQTREYIDWRQQLSCVHIACWGWGCMPTPLPPYLAPSTRVTLPPLPPPQQDKPDIATCTLSQPLSPSLWICHCLYKVLKVQHWNFRTIERGLRTE